MLYTRDEMRSLLNDMHDIDNVIQMTRNKEKGNEVI